MIWYEPCVGVRPVVGGFVLYQQLCVDYICVTATDIDYTYNSYKVRHIILQIVRCH